MNKEGGIKKQEGDNRGKEGERRQEGDCYILDCARTQFIHSCVLSTSPSVKTNICRGIPAKILVCYVLFLFIYLFIFCLFFFGSYLLEVAARK